MSLSFVASAVQTGTSDGNFEETPIENKEVEAVNKRNAHKPLFEQLRDNQEDTQAKWEQENRERMRGTCALDEHDVAHLAALEQQRQTREHQVKKQTKEELALFRAAKAERQQALLEVQSDEEEVDSNAKPQGNVATKSTPQLAPKIKVKKRKLRDSKFTAHSMEEKKGKPDSDTKEENPQTHEEALRVTKQIQPGLSNLLSGYGSSSDEDAE